MKSSDGYKAFQRFSETDYGSSVIKEMISNPKKYKGFDIAEGYKRGAKANYSVLLLPKRFPAPPGFFKTSGQKIYDLAIIYHEFAHTAVFRPASTSDAAITIFDERLAVMNFENPVRIRMGYEPRYSYTMGNGSYTINIITGKKVAGERTVSKYDPTILVELHDKDALK